MDAYALDLARYFTDHQREGIAILEGWLRDQKLLCKPGGCPNTPLPYDLDEDGAQEYVITLSDPRWYPSYCGSPQHVSQRVYILDCQPAPAYCRVYPIGRLWEQAGDGACIIAVSDFNQDTNPELLVLYSVCGAADCFDSLELATCEGSYRCRYLTSDIIEVHNGCFFGQDVDGDNATEILALTFDQPGSEGMAYDSAGKPRFGSPNPYISVYKWDGNQYALAAWAYIRGNLFHVIWEGMQWARIGELQTALATFREALADQGLPLDESGFPLKAYAQYAIGILQARLGHSEEARAALMEVQDLDPDRIFAPLVDVFLGAYNTGDCALACAALTEYVKGPSDDGRFRGPYALDPLITLCPEDRV